MKKALSLILGCILLFQSCSVYKSTTFNDIKEGKNYIVTMTSGKIIEARCTGIISDAAFFGINNTDVKIPFNKIEELKRKKVSPVVLIGGLAVAVLTAVLVIKGNTEEDIIDGEE